MTQDGSPLITSNRNPAVRSAAALVKRRERQARGQFLIEGTRELSRARAAGIRLVQVFIDPASLHRPPGSDHRDRRQLERLVAGASADGAQVIEVTPEVLARLAYREGTEPVVAVAEMFDTGLARLDPGPTPLLLIMAEVEKPGNIGAMLRTAAAAGVEAVIVADPVADVFNPNVVRASVGALFTVPVAVADAGAVLNWCRDRGVTVLAATPDGARPHWEVPMTGPCAVVVGSEHAGLGPVWLERADGRLTIPMAEEMISGADSMNVANAAAVLLFEAVRQRAG